MIAHVLTKEVGTLTEEGASFVLSAARQAALEKMLGVSIAVVDRAGGLLAFVRLNGAVTTTADAAMGKARSAAQLGVPTRVFEDMLHGGMTALLSLQFLCPLRGGLPISISGEVIGAVGVSGGSGNDDELICQAGLSAFVEALRAVHCHETN